MLEAAGEPVSEPDKLPLREVGGVLSNRRRVQESLALMGEVEGEAL
jgi:hypothetical protein